MPNAVLVFNNVGRLDHSYFISNNMLTLLQDTRHQFQIATGGDPKKAVAEYEQKTWPGRAYSKIELSDVLVGKYLRSVARPIYRLNGDFGGLINPGADQELEEIKNTWREIEVLTHDLEHCFNVNSPFEANWDSYGLYYERIIYIACIGVESLFRKILDDNAINTPGANMNLFVRLKPHLRLEEYSVRLQRYPWLKPVASFANWDTSNPSKSLPWYQAYNSLKHDKRRNQHVASMKNAISAVVAYYCLSYATFGYQIHPDFFTDYRYFLVESFPKWDASECFLESDSKTWAPVSIVL